LHDCRLESENAIEIVGNYDLVLDGSDNFATRYLTNDVCVFLKKPLVYGSIFRFDGQTTVFAPHLGGPCYRCMFPEPPPPGSVPNCADAGVLGVLPGIIGVMQATEAIKLILGIGESLLGRLVHLDALQMRFREFKLRRDPNCPVCGENPTVLEPIDYEQFCSGTAGRSEPTVPTITVHALNSKQQSGEPFLLVDVREPFESDLARIAGSKLMPLGQLPDRLNELNQQEVTVLYCKTGLRSERAVQFLQTAGFQNVYNLAGGIDAWIDEIDPRIPKY
jgi:adenylyltransferase/sulfurtransferase